MNFKDTVYYSKKTFNIKGKVIDCSMPLIMGILNITPDSFYTGSRFRDKDKILMQTQKMLDEGADIIDIGAYSTRPGADYIPPEEELNRLIPVIEMIHQYFPGCIISADTFRSQVAKEAIHAGAAIINDISGGNLDANMFDTIACMKAAYVLMHSKGDPQTMQSLARYTHIETDIIDDLQKKLIKLRNAGIKDIIIDPGIGFAKTIEQNFRILRNLQEFQTLNEPILIGISRKSMIHKFLNKRPEDALNGTTILNTIGLINKGDILRVHDVQEAKEVVQLYKKVYSAQ